MEKSRGAKMGASLLYYAVLSLAPLVIIVIAIVGLVFGRDAAREGLIAQVQALAGPDGASMINTMIASAQKPNSGILSAAIGVLTLVFGASGVFSELLDSLNKIWEVKATPASGVWAMICERFLTFGMVLGIGFLLLVSLLLSAALAAFGKFFGDSLPLPAFVLQGANMPVSIVVITLLFAAIYRFLPAERLAWSHLFGLVRSVRQYCLSWVSFSSACIWGTRPWDLSMEPPGRSLYCWCGSITPRNYSF